MSDKFFPRHYEIAPETWQRLARWLERNDRGDLVNWETSMIWIRGDLLWGSGRKCSARDNSEQLEICQELFQELGISRDLFGSLPLPPPPIENLMINDIND